jgi:hypothetical protein
VPRNRRHGWRSRVALGAVYLLVVQALLAGLTTGVSAARLPRDAFDFVICSSNDAKHVSHSTGQQRDGSDPPNCCVVGCSMFVPNVAPLPATGSMQVGRMLARLVAISFTDVEVDRHRVRSPGNSRAPPRFT